MTDTGYEPRATFAGGDARAAREPVATECKLAATEGLIVLKTCTGLRFESTADVEWLEADRNHVIFHVRGEQVRVRAKLSELESTLDPNRFLRISRSSMVNLAHVREAVSLESGRFLFEMRSGRQLPSNRGCARAIRSFVAPVRLW